MIRAQWLRPTAVVVGVAALVVAIDQATKSWALGLENDVVHILWTLRLRLTFNDGAAFGLGSGIPAWVLMVVLAALVVYIVKTAEMERVASGVAAGLIIGGASGNLVDRLFRGHDGVIDFIDLQWWPVFNFADVSIVIGVTVLLILQLSSKNS